MSTPGDRAAPASLFIVGVGPGDPDLMTLRAAAAIASVDVVAYPTTQSGRARAREIAAAHVRPDQAELPFLVPMRTERGPAQNAYDRAATDIRGHLGKGRHVAVLCEGDAFFYGSAMYLYARLRDCCPVTVIPGVTSLTACASASGEPLAARNDILKIIPAPLDAEDIERELSGTDAAAIIKVGRHFEKVYAVLARLDLLGRATAIVSATTAEQQIVRLDTPQDGNARPYFSTILVARGEPLWT